MSSSMALRRSPKPGAFTAHDLRSREMVDDQGRQRLAVDVLGDDQQARRPSRRFEHRQHVADDVIFLS